MTLIPTLLCPKSWEGMTGSETERFCSYCKKHVHNLEALSVSERLALLSSPAASICSRYKIAIRRPAKGQKESYQRHLLKYGTGVALTGAVLVVLWEWHGQEEKQRYYKAAGISPAEQGMPRHLYVEHQSLAVGMLTFDRALESETGSPYADLNAPKAAEFRLDVAEIDRLIQQTKPQFVKEKHVVELKK